MLTCRISGPADPFVQYVMDETKDEHIEFYGSDEEMLNNIDFTSIDLDDVDTSVFESAFFNCSDDESDGECVNLKFRVIRNHDCMLSGQCCNKEFPFPRTTVGPVPKPPPPPPANPPANLPPTAPAPAPAPPSVLITHSANKVVTIVPASERTDSVMVRTVQKPENRSLLLNRTTVNSPVKTPAHTPTPVKREFPTPQNSRPETPQSEEDDLTPIPIDTHNTTNVFRSALEVISTPRCWDDEPETPSPQSSPSPSQTEIMRLSEFAKSDHNYDGSNKNIRLEGLGVDTPSDSEEDEEIDVVSLSERSSASSRSSSSRSSSCGALPTRPTRRDQRHLEEITTSLLSASQAVSRKLKASHPVMRQQHHAHKRKKYSSESSDCEEDDEEEEEEKRSSSYKYQHQHRSKRQKSTPTRRKKSNKYGEVLVEDSQEKRDLHNNMERMRRIDLRNSFEELKSLVPETKEKERAAKVVILREAASYCRQLSTEAREKCQEVMALKQEQKRLRAMLSGLRRAHAAAYLAAQTSKTR